MIILINAGGSGTRLWPLSTQDLPKQFLSLVDQESLLQSSFKRALLTTSLDKIYVSISNKHIEITKEQLPELPDDQLIVEPSKRDTMPSILNAMQTISQKCSQTEAIISIHSDQYIEDSDNFIQDLKRGAELSENYARIVLMGMAPDKPGPKFGHIHKAKPFKNEEDTFEVSGFKEKPDFKLAKKYQESGEYLWNAGYFIAPYKIFVEAIKFYADPIWLKSLEDLAQTKTKKQRDEVYLNLKKEAIETALTEKSQGLLVIPQKLKWMDVGSFDDIHRVNKKDKNQNVVKSNDAHLVNTRGSLVHSSIESRPIALIGLEDVIVIDTPEGLLVANIKESQEVKKITEILKVS
jgi:mannose-1-phosphate guanylyltransferase/mannose-6-phosphate isomerase